VKVMAAVECRMSSRRLPGKNARLIAGKPMLARLLERLKHAGKLDEIVVATTTDAGDEPLVEIAKQEGVSCHRGSLDDVMSRVIGAARSVNADVIVTITGDCPLSDPRVIDAVVARYFTAGADYVANIIDDLTFPAGFDVQVFSRECLEGAAALTSRPQDREDVTRYFYEHPDAYRLLNLRAPAEVDRPRYWLCADTAEDFALLTHIFETLLPTDPLFGIRDIIELLDNDPARATSNIGRPGMFSCPSSGGRAAQEQMTLEQIGAAR